MRALLLFVVLAMPLSARADAIDPWNPTLAEVCGGTMHHPNCGGAEAAGVCCGMTVVALGAIGVVLAARGRREKR